MGISEIDISGMYQMYPLSFFVYVLFIGLVVGSFLNVVILRLPFMEDLVDGEDGRFPKTLMGRSYCGCCKARLPWYVNIPVFSWLALRGKSKCCGSKIHWRYPAIEVLTSLVTGVMFYVFGPTSQMVFASIAAYLMICLTVIDIEHMVLPDKLTYGLLWLSLLASVFSVFRGPSEAIVGAITGYLFIGLINGVFRWRTGRSGMGGGDYKLTAALGALGGGLAVPEVVGLASLIFVVVILCLPSGKRSDPHPFGPALILGFAFYSAYGPFFISTAGV
jgi:leader peptidase (prepilin peptidase)/N-methyltransferase